MEFSKEFFDRIKASVLEAKKKNPGPYYAAFDADGTLWSCDAGETFFRYQIEKCNLKDLPSDPWGYYLEMKETDAPGSCLLLAQINKGQTEQQVRQWADACFREYKNFPFYKSKRELFDFLKINGIETFVVTASIKWAVEPAARALGLDNDHVIGVETVKKNGVLTEKGVEPLPYGPGKADAFLARTKGIHPILSAGNTISDAPLIDTSVGVKLAVASHEPGDTTHENEMLLKEHALTNGWLWHQYYKG